MPDFPGYYKVMILASGGPAGEAGLAVPVGRAPGGIDERGICMKRRPLLMLGVVAIATSLLLPAQEGAE